MIFSHYFSTTIVGVIIISDDEEECGISCTKDKQRIAFSRAELLDIAQNMKMEFPKERLRHFMEKDSDADLVILYRVS